MTINTALDLFVEFIFTGATFMLGFMTAAGQLVNPTPTAWLVGALTGLVGAANQYRALKKAPV